jgi:hypothetical protein
MPDRRSWWIAPPNSPISALSLRIFRGRGSSTATLGALDRFRVQGPVVRLEPFLDVEHALSAAQGVSLANEGDHLSQPRWSITQICELVAVHRGREAQVGIVELVYP